MAFGKQQHNTQGETETYISDTQEHDYVDLDDEVQQTAPTSTATSGSGASGSQIEYAVYEFREKLSLKKELHDNISQE
ncbi:hypothetical protein E3N88_31743 [Mikania micrantha]|uniref:Uncharacterized protein n=1 Tax=Mikania micrantha TaxID=192012 RepID=A0A5N6M6H9_9ASTR|nr:hypothetical protein E3N88_31743 [Mikania micrantha]